jgi:hypothetical protein
MQVPAPHAKPYQDQRPLGCPLRADNAHESGQGGGGVRQPGRRGSAARRSRDGVGPRKWRACCRACPNGLHIAVVASWSGPTQVRRRACRSCRVRGARRRRRPGLLLAVLNPNVRFDVGAQIPLAIDVEGAQSMLDDVVTGGGQGLLAPALPVCDGAAHDLRVTGCGGRLGLGANEP